MDTHTQLKYMQRNPHVAESRAEVLHALGRLLAVDTYRKGSLLFHQGQPADGVYVLRTGSARLLLAGVGGAEFQTAGPGCLLGLPAAIRNDLHDFSAELLENSQVGFISREDLLAHLRQDRDLCFCMVQLLGAEVVAAYGLIRAAHRRQERYIA